MSPQRANAKRVGNMARYTDFLFALIDADLTTHASIDAVQHGAPDQFYGVVRFSFADSLHHERLANLYEFAKLWGAKLTIENNRVVFYLGRD